MDIQTTDQEIGLGLIPTGDGSGSGTGSGTGSPDTPPGDAGEGLSGEADSSWDDDGVGTGADDDGGNSCQEGPTFPTPAPPPVPPTGTTLQWNNFRVVATSPVGGDEDAQITYTRRWVSGYEITTRSPTVEIGPLYSASATVTLYDITYSAEFNAARSWVVNGKQTDRLLEHERLHLRIGEYITQKIAARYPYLEGRGQAIGDTRQAAESAARAQAKLALAARVKQMEDEWTRIDTAVQTRYDTQTDHGQDFVNQFAWGMEYRDDVDKEFGGRR